MKPTLLSLALCCSLPLLAQTNGRPANGGTPPTGSPLPAAEQLFRDAWWAESGANDTEGALRGYLAAAAADGPAAVRARALVFAGRLQQRLGKADQALASFRRVVTDFATESQAVGEARTHLRELTAVDLRQNYDEWYERRLFSEEVQLVILGKLEAAASLLSDGSGSAEQQRARHEQANVLLAELLPFGKGAVPALRKAAVGAHGELAERAISLLFRLGEVPPLRALLERSEWLSDSDAVRRLCTTRTGERLPGGGADADGRARFVDTDRDGIPDQRVAPERLSPHERVVAAAMDGPQALAALVVADCGLQEHELSPLVAALLFDAQARATLLAALRRNDVPLGVRSAIEETLTRGDLDPMLTTAEWLAVGEEPLRAELRAYAARRVAATVTANDGEAFDRLLHWVVEQEPLGLTMDLREQLFGGLTEHRAPELAPWTPQRLALVLRTVGSGDPANAMPQFWSRLRRAASFRATMALAVLDDPVALVTAFRRDGDDAAAVESLAAHFAGDLDSQHDAQLMARRWHEAVAAALPAAWAKLDEKARLAALIVLQGVRHPADAKAPALRAFLEQQAKGESAAVRAAIEQTLAAFVN
jgi:hypothetical protein